MLKIEFPYFQLKKSSTNSKKKNFIFGIKNKKKHRLQLQSISAYCTAASMNTLYEKVTRKGDKESFGFFFELFLLNAFAFKFCYLFGVFMCMKNSEGRLFSISTIYIKTNTRIIK